MDFFLDEELRKIFPLLRDWVEQEYELSSKGVERPLSERSRELRWLLLCVCYILLGTGIRPGTELWNIQWQDVSVLTKRNGKRFLRLWIRHSKTRPHAVVTELGLMRVFDQLRARSKLTEPSDLVFGENWNITRHTLTRMFHQFLAEHNMLTNARGEPLVLYSFRHTYITNQLLNGVTPQVLADTCGTSINMIDKHYSHITAELAAEQLASQSTVDEYLDYKKLERHLGKLREMALHETHDILNDPDAPARIMDQLDSVLIGQDFDQG